MIETYYDNRRVSELCYLLLTSTREEQACGKVEQAAVELAAMGTNLSEVCSQIGDLQDWLNHMMDNNGGNTG